MRGKNTIKVINVLLKRERFSIYAGNGWFRSPSIPNKSTVEKLKKKSSMNMMDKN